VPEPFTSNAETQEIDNSLYAKKLQKLVDKEFPKADLKIASDHFNILIVGQVDSQGTKEAVVELIKKQQAVREVFDYTTITENPSYDSSSSIVYKVQERLSKEPDIISKRITVIYADGVIYLMGTNIGDLSHLARAIKGIYVIEGVTKVVNLVIPGRSDYNSGR
jgi:osmotically-inducible protein OsmY